ncbi:hypothetical protein BGZ60DRAFT_430356 [Tricladium varicosporioides]|nr:hypothetical protein BGZ60DRAFT_430356 [Hymenoscyphus varicosporioides]
MARTPQRRVPKTESAKSAVEHYLKTCPKPLPSVRPRSLTSHSIPKVDIKTFKLQQKQEILKSKSDQQVQTFAQTTVMQDHMKGFFSLPLELRQNIYFDAFNAPEDFRCTGKSILQIIQTELQSRRLCYVPCLWHGHTHHYTGCYQTRNGEAAVIVPHMYKTEHYNNRELCVIGDVKNGPLALLTTCRMIYREAIDVLYSRHQFYFRHLLNFIDFARTVLPQRLNSIRSVHLVFPLTDAKIQDHFDHQMSRTTGDPQTTEERVFKILSGMENLTELEVQFEGTVGRKPGRKVELMLPLAVVRQTERFNVSVWWHTKEGEDKLGDVPYTLHWSEKYYAGFEEGDESPWEDYIEGEFDEAHHTEAEFEGVENR